MPRPHRAHEGGESPPPLFGVTVSPRLAAGVGQARRGWVLLSHVLNAGGSYSLLDVSGASTTEWYLSTDWFGTRPGIPAGRWWHIWSDMPCRPFLSVPVALQTGVYPPATCLLSAFLIVGHCVCNPQHPPLDPPLLPSPPPTPHVYPCPAPSKAPDDHSAISALRPATVAPKEVAILSPSPAGPVEGCAGGGLFNTVPSPVLLPFHVTL